MKRLKLLIGVFSTLIAIGVAIVTFVVMLSKSLENISFDDEFNFFG